MGSKIFDLLGSIVVVAALTTLVLPKRQTTQVIGAAGNAFTGAIRAATGQ